MKHPITDCCGYTCTTDRPYPVMWNEFNRVVQCHNCGQVFAPKSRRTPWLVWRFRIGFYWWRLKGYTKQEAAYWTLRSMGFK